MGQAQALAECLDIFAAAAAQNVDDLPARGESRTSNRTFDIRVWSCIALEMATKTITLEIDAYERLKRAKRTPRESFSEVVRRLPMPAGAITAGQYLALARERGALLTEDDARAIDELNLADQPPHIP